MGSDENEMRQIKEELISETRRDQILGKIMSDSAGRRMLGQGFRVEENLVLKLNQKSCRKWVLAVPGSCKNQMLQIFHDDMGHLGTYQMATIMRQIVRWRRMERDIKQYDKTCHECQLCKFRNETFEVPFHSVIPRVIYVDILGPLAKSKGGVCHILVVLCSFTTHPSIWYEKFQVRSLFW